MRKLVIPCVAAAALVLAAAVSAAQIPRTPRLPAGWSHAAINVVIRRQPHTLTYDRGRVQTVTASSLTIREQDGSVWTIDVAPNANITIDGRPASLSQVRRLEIAVTVEVDGGAAVSVKVTIPPALAAQIARQSRRGTRQ
jgi:hypothetical protein